METKLLNMINEIGKISFWLHVVRLNVMVQMNMRIINLVHWTPPTNLSRTWTIMTLFST